MPHFPPIAACASTNCSSCAASSRRVRGPAMRSSAAPSASMAQVAGKPGHSVSTGAAIEIDDPARRYVSRAALKLIAGLDHFGFDPTGCLALDIGASTGGFTQVLLERGAAHVTAIDVGHGQFAPALADDPRVSLIEGLNARDLTAGRSGRAGARLHRLRRQLHFAEAGLAAGAGTRRARRQARCCWSSRNSRPAAPRSARAACCAIPKPAPRIAEELRDWLDTMPGWRALGLLPVADRGRRRQPGIPARRSEGPVSVQLTIARLGAQGDGVAETERGPVFVPFALPGEEVAATVERDRAALLWVTKPSPLRVEPACRHFGTCGGCAIQHLDAAAYHSLEARHRRQRAEEPRHRGAGRRPRACAPHTRRRATFTARRTERGMLLGYNKALSNEIVAIEECPILLPEIVAALDRLRELAGADLRHAAAFPHRRHRDRLRPRHRRRRERQAVRGGAPRRLAFRDGPAALRGCRWTARSSSSRESPYVTFDGIAGRPFRPAPSCRRPKRPSRRWPGWSARIWRAPRRSPTCFPAAAPSRCGLPASRKCMRSKATRLHLPHSTGPIAMRPG